MLAQKGSVPQNGPNMSHMDFLSVPGGYILKSCAQTKFEAERLKIAPFRNDRTYLDPKLPHFYKPILEQNLEFRTLPPCR